MGQTVRRTLLALALTAGVLSMLLRSSQEPSAPLYPSKDALDQTLPNKLDTTPTSTRTGLEAASITAPPSQPDLQSRPFLADSRPDRRIKGEVTAIVLSSKKDRGFETRFAADTKEVYIEVATRNMDPKTRLEASFRITKNKEGKFSTPVIEDDLTRRRTFTLKEPPGGWKPGAYQLIIRISSSDKILSLSRFEIKKPDAPPANTYPSPEYMELTNSLEAESSGTNVFEETSSQIYLRIDSSKLEPGVEISSVWSAVEVSELAPLELIATSTLPAPSSEEDTVFTFTPPRGGFHPGSYRVDLYFDQVIVGSQAFFIESGSVAESKATATP